MMDEALAEWKCILFLFLKEKALLVKPTNLFYTGLRLHLPGGHNYIRSKKMTAVSKEQSLLPPCYCQV